MKFFADIQQGKKKNMGQVKMRDIEKYKGFWIVSDVFFLSCNDFIVLL